MKEQIWRRLCIWLRKFKKLIEKCLKLILQRLVKIKVFEDFFKILLKKNKNYHPLNLLRLMMNYLIKVKRKLLVSIFFIKTPNTLEKNNKKVPVKKSWQIFKFYHRKKILVHLIKLQTTIHKIERVKIHIRLWREMNSK